MRSPFRFSHIFKKTQTPAQQRRTGFSIPEVLIGSVILASAVTMTAQLSNSTVDGMKRMDLRSKLDSALAARMEEIREQAFQLHCESGCEPSQLTNQLKYNTTTIKPLCETNTLGSSLLSTLSNAGLNQDFNLRDYDDTDTTTTPSPSILIQSTLNASGNLVTVSFTEPNTPLTITSTIVPHAQGWCP